jgi:hypothetical protein
MAAKNALAYYYRGKKGFIVEAPLFLMDLTLSPNLIFEVLVTPFHQHLKLLPHN